MFGLSWTQILMIVVIGVFVLGPERIPVAVKWLTSSLKRLREMAAGAQDQLNSQMGPEIAEIRRQIADLQSLKELQDLRELRDLHPKNLIGKGLFGDNPPPTGVADLLGIDTSKLSLTELGAPKPDDVPDFQQAPSVRPYEEIPTAEPAVGESAGRGSDGPGSAGDGTTMAGSPTLTKPHSANGPAQALAADPVPIADPIPTADPVPDQVSLQGDPIPLPDHRG